jgi:hypothetical protein
MSFMTIVGDDWNNLVSHVAARCHRRSREHKLVRDWSRLNVRER